MTTTTKEPAEVAEPIHQLPVRLKRSTFDKLRRLVYRGEYRSANSAITALIEREAAQEALKK